MVCRLCVVYVWFICLLRCLVFFVVLVVNVSCCCVVIF